MIAVKAGMAGTLDVQGILWTYSKYNGKVAFGHVRHVIYWDTNVGAFLIIEEDETVFLSSSIAECLEESSEIVLDYYANKITPSWEN